MSNASVLSFSFKESFDKAKQLEKEQINQACYDGYYQEEPCDVRTYFDDIYGK